MATIWRSSPLSNRWQASAACFTPDATWESNWCTALRPPGRNPPEGKHGQTEAGRKRLRFSGIFRFLRQPIQWFSSDRTNHWIISSDYPVIIQWLFSDYHSWSSDTTWYNTTVVDWSAQKKKAPFSPVFLWPRLSQLASTAALQWPGPHVTEFLGSQALGVGKPGWIFNVAMKNHHI